MCLRSSVSMEMLGSVCKAIRILVLRVCQEFRKGQWPWSGHPSPGVLSQQEAVKLCTVLAYFPNTLSQGEILLLQGRGPNGSHRPGGRR